MNAPLGTHAYWTPEAPEWSRLDQLPVPLFLGPPARSGLLRAGVATARHPLRSTGALGTGIGARDLISFQLWVDTARALGIETVDDITGRPLPLPRSRPPRGAATKAPIAPAIGVAMIVQDEEERLGTALSSVVGWAADVVVVDGGSKDATPDIARRAGARVLERKFDGDFASQRNAALEALGTPWVLSLDADEAVSPELVPVLQAVAASGVVDAASIHHLNILEGHGEEPWFWPDRHVRLFRGSLRWRGRIHEAVDGVRRTAYLPISGPFIVHRKPLADQWDRERLYLEIDPARYSPEDMERIRRWADRRHD